MRIYRRTIKQRDGAARPSKVWWAEFRTPDGTRHRLSTHRRDRGAATKWAQDRLTDLEREAVGLPRLQAAQGEPSTALGELVASYLGDLERSGRSDKHIENLRRQLGRMTAGFETVEHLTTSAIRDRLSELLRRGVPSKKGDVIALTARTVDAHRRALLAFLRWLPDDEAPERDPMRKVGPLKVTADESPRRALTEAELARLLVAAPPVRRIAYQLAATTGLRRGELDALRWTDLDLDAGTLTVRGSTAKNGKTVTLPLPRGTVEALQPIEGAGELVLPRGSPDIRTMRRDLERAKVKYQTAEGRADFHALRVRYVTKLVETGLHPKAVQRLARHSTPHLTLAIYARLRGDVESDAVAALDVGAGG